MNQCYYCKTEADLVLNNRAMVCPLCNGIKGALSLQDFDTHAYLAFSAGQYTLEQFKNISATIKQLTALRRKLSAKKGQITRIANDTGWRDRYKELCIKATGKAPTVYPDATYTPDIEKFIQNFINWQGGKVRKRNTEGLARNCGGKIVRIKNANRGEADITGQYRGIYLNIEVKNKFTKDTFKETVKGKQTAQAKERDRCIAAGEVYYIATDIDSFLVWWDNTIAKMTLL